MVNSLLMKTHIQFGASFKNINFECKNRLFYAFISTYLVKLNNNQLVENVLILS